MSLEEAVRQMVLLVKLAGTGVLGWQALKMIWAERYSMAIALICGAAIFAAFVFGGEEFFISLKCMATAIFGAKC